MIENGIDDLSSNPKEGSFHFPMNLNILEKVEINLFLPSTS